MTHISGVQYRAWYAPVSYWLILISSHSSGVKKWTKLVLSVILLTVFYMTMMARTLLDEWKEEKYLRHYTIAHVLGTINWRWFEREEGRERIKQIIKYCLWQHIKKRSRERERFAVSNVPIVSSNVFARAKMYWIRSTPWSYITCSLINSLSPFSSFSFSLPLSLILFFSFDLAQSVNITKLLRKKNERTVSYDQK